MVTATRAARCGWKKPGGEACGAFASKISGLCSRHDPARQEEPVVLAPIRRGKRRMDPRAIRLAMGVVMEDVVLGRLSPNAARAMVTAANAWLAANAQDELMGELEELRLLATEKPMGSMPLSSGPVTDDDFEKLEEDS